MNYMSDNISDSDNNNIVYNSHIWARRSNPTNKEYLQNAIGRSWVIKPQNNYAEQIYQILYKTIIEGRLPPGSPLPEQALVSFFQISRTPIRTALQRLILDDLVWVFPQSITIVAPVKKAKITEGMFVRMALESSNLRQVVKNITDNQLNELAEILQNQKKAISQKDFNTFNIYDDAFHQKLFAFTNRSNIWEYIIPIKKHLDRIRWLLVSNVPKHIEVAYQEHMEVFNNLQNLDEAKLIASLENHINSVTDHFIKFPQEVLSKYLVD